MHQIAAFKFFSWGGMLALVFSPHRGMAVKGEPPICILVSLSWCHDVEFSKVNN